MYCSKCGNEIKEGEKFCSKCGNSIENKSSDKKQHWIKNTKLAQYCKKNEKFRKILCVVIVVICLGSVFSCIFAFSDIDTAKMMLEINGDNYFRIKLILSRIQLYVSIVLIFVSWHYGQKIVEKD